MAGPSTRALPSRADRLPGPPCTAPSGRRFRESAAAMPAAAPGMRSPRCRRRVLWRRKYLSGKQYAWGKHGAVGHSGHVDAAGVDRGEGGDPSTTASTNPASSRFVDDAAPATGSRIPGAAYRIGIGDDETAGRGLLIPAVAEFSLARRSESAVQDHHQRRRGRHRRRAVDAEVAVAAVRSLSSGWKYRLRARVPPCFRRRTVQGEQDADDDHGNQCDPERCACHRPQWNHGSTSISHLWPRCASTSRIGDMCGQPAGGDGRPSIRFRIKTSVAQQTPRRRQQRTTHLHGHVRDAPPAPTTSASSASACRPQRLVTNEEICGALGVDSDWIYTRTGIRARRFCGRDENITTMSIAAGRAALANSAGLTGADIDASSWPPAPTAVASPSAAPPGGHCCGGQQGAPPWI